MKISPPAFFSWLWGLKVSCSHWMVSRDNFLLTFSTVRLKNVYVLDSLLIIGYQEMLIYFIRFPPRSVLVSITIYFNAMAFDCSEK